MNRQNNRIAKSNIEQWPALDCVKFLCVFWMIVLHAFYFVGANYGSILFPPESWMYKTVQATMFLGFFPLMLPVTAGCMLRASLSPSATDFRFRHTDVVRIMITSLFIGVMGCTMTVMAVGWSMIWHWNVLQFVGLSFAVLAILLVIIPVHGIAILGAVTIFAAPYLRTAIPDVSFYWLNVLYGGPSGSFYWPFFPWFGTVVLGFCIAHLYCKYGDSGRFQRYLTRFGVGSLLAGFGCGDMMPKLDRYDLMGSAIFQPATSSMLGLVGVACLIFSAISKWGKNWSFSRYGIIRCYSRGILWVYIVHLAVACRVSGWLYSMYDWEEVLKHPWHRAHPYLLFGFPIFLLALSWGVGYISIRLLEEKRIKIQLRKV